jgi:transposase-like protein
MGKKIGESVLDELLKGCERPEDLLGDGGLMKHLNKALMPRMLGAELTEDFGYDRRSRSRFLATGRAASSLG